MQDTSNKTVVFEYGEAGTTNASMPQDAMMQEIKAILKNHNALNRFGLARISSEHNPQIVMNENCLLPQRWLVTTPKAKTTIAVNEVLETQWRFDVPGMLKACETTCENTPDGHGHIGHSGQGQQKPK